VPEAIEKAEVYRGSRSENPMTTTKFYRCALRTRRYWKGGGFRSSNGGKESGRKDANFKKKEKERTGKRARGVAAVNKGGNGQAR